MIFSRSPRSRQFLEAAVKRHQGRIVGFQNLFFEALKTLMIQYNGNMKSRLQPVVT